MKTAALLNDTTRETGHVGCVLTVKNIIAAGSEAGIRIIHRDRCNNGTFDDRAFSTAIDECDLVIVNGEGTLHHNAGAQLWRRCEIAASLGKPLFLVNAVWQGNDSTRKFLSLFELIFVREPASHRELREDGRPDARVVPDMVFFAPPAVRREKNLRDGIAIDSVILDVTHEISRFAISKRMAMYYMGAWHRRNFAKHHPVKFIRTASIGGTILDTNRISAAKFVVTGRYHGACLSIAAATPFLAIASNTHKIEGLAEHIGLDLRSFVLPIEGLCAERIGEGLTRLLGSIDRDEYAAKCKEYVASARDTTLQMFRDIYKH